MVYSHYVPVWIHNAIQEMNTLKIGILGISEMKWQNLGEFTKNGHKIYYSGDNINHHQHQVGILYQYRRDHC